MPVISESGDLTFVRLHRGAVVLDRSGRSIVEVKEVGALALDLLFDRRPDFPRSAEEAERQRNVLREIRRELLGEVALRSEQSLPLELSEGTNVLRRYGAPPRWSRMLRAVDLDEGRGALVTVGIVQSERGVLALLGRPSLVLRVVEAFPLERPTATRRAHILHADPRLVQPRGAPRPMEVDAFWRISAGSRPGLTLSRLPPERALVGLLSATTSRPALEDLSTLADCAERAHHFSAVLPRDSVALARVVADYADTKLSR